ncbi:MAG: FAD-dependent oxidoreductase [Actinophytocola sp.]|uniref:FAD-dependent oxidoreductase n=1 Tax=Actinophytocola sp. TaxID=1872138 RepID=UPI003D6ABDE6
MSKRLRVAVVGGGTGGLALAQALHQAGVHVSVYERSRLRTERLQGYRVHINPHGSRALHECLPPDLWRAFVATCGSPGSSFSFVTEQLAELLRVEEELTSGPARDPVTAHHSVSRITLHQVLSAGLDGVLHHGKEFERYTRADDGTVTLHFADGTTATANVLVAADGAASRVRGQYLPHAERVDTGVRTIAGKLPLTEETKRWLPTQLHTGPNNVIPPAGCGMFVAPHELDAEAPVVNGIGGNDGTFAEDTVLFDNTGSYVMWAYAADHTRLGPDAELSAMDGAALRDLVGRLTEGWHPSLRRLVADSPEQSVSLLPIRTSVRIPRWETTNITLLGDAIHSMTPFRGIGANTALRDAQLLARNLIAAARGETDLLSAIHDYETHMIDYGFAAVRMSRRTAAQTVSTNRISRSMFKASLRMFSAIPPLKRKVFSDLGSK